MFRLCLQLMNLHTAASDLLARVLTSNTLAHMLDTLRQAATGKEFAGAWGNLEIVSWSWWGTYQPGQYGGDAQSKLDYLSSTA